MQFFPPTLVIRHRKENLLKCSLRGLENRPDFSFLTYPTEELPSVEQYVLLAIDAPPLDSSDSQQGLLILDGTWRYAEKMLEWVQQKSLIKRRSIPAQCRTAYPRCQTACPFPEQGLASIEAIYIAYIILKRDPSHLLDHYYWKEEFLRKNKPFLDALRL
ncbi:DTW domain-containing protein [Parachlamydia sp. AcF125]|uniref:DTW domain-containing protein n=1 Tax=Parachlamydia sp. AcF125 TaxID=2795736 RepID=UPI001BCA3948|nr:DTW domain-containing protein [Parachlamydia sp. AcF125]MBS4168796.1 hypothetical protein [Parachlamydia sp. AcF125]